MFKIFGTKRCSSRGIFCASLSLPGKKAWPTNGILVVFWTEWKVIPVFLLAGLQRQKPSPLEDKGSSRQQRDIFQLVSVCLHINGKDTGKTKPETYWTIFSWLVQSGHGALGRIWSNTKRESQSKLGHTSSTTESRLQRKGRYEYWQE